MANRVFAPERSWREPSPLLPAAVRWLRRLCEHEALPMLVIAMWVSLLTLELPALFGPDSWLSLVGGRYVAEHGLPHVDSLTYWTLGHPWVDQQWGAQLALYEVALHGGVRAALLLGVGCVGAALVLATVASRRLGASARSAAIGAALPLLGAPWFAQVRTQSLAVPLFVAVYALLAADSRRPGRRVLLTLPLLVIWANLHGSVALGAGLVALYGLSLLRRRPTRGRGAALAVAAPLTLLVSPYGLKLVGYYHLMLLHPPLARYVSEWQPASVRAVTVFFFASVLAGVALWGAHRSRLTGFERWATVLLLVAALTAIRNAVWFELALAIAFPRLLDGAWPSRIELTTGVRRVNVVLALVSVAGVVAAFGAQASHGSSWLHNGRTPDAAATVAAAAGTDGIVIADEVDSDWLLWERPELAGRIAYDVRFELFNARQLQQIDRLDGVSHSVWSRCASRARVVTFPGKQFLAAARREGVLAPGSRVIVRTRTFIAVEQPARGAFCKL
jgi:hypothetical protein